jgi:hypothetical protein
VERRTARPPVLSPSRRAAPLAQRARRRPALHHAAFLSPAPHFRTGRLDGLVTLRPPGQLPPPVVPAASSHLRQPVIVPADGSAGASRVQGYKPCPRAPPPPPVTQCPAERPSRGVVSPRIIWRLIGSQGGGASFTTSSRVGNCCTKQGHKNIDQAKIG